MKNKKKILTLVLSIASVFVLVAGAITGSYAVFSESKSNETAGEAGEVTIKPVSISTTCSDKLMPGDVFDFYWTVENAGNASILTRNTVYVYWDFDDTVSGAENGDENIFVYRQSTPASTIRSEMLNKSPKAYNIIDFGSLTSFSLNGKTYSGYKFTVYGDHLDGVGTDAQTGADKEVDYDSSRDDNSSYYDVVSFKIALSQYANIHTSGQKLKITVVTEAMQYENTDDADWTAISTNTITIN